MTDHERTLAAAIQAAFGALLVIGGVVIGGLAGLIMLIFGIAAIIGARLVGLGLVTPGNDENAKTRRR
jgi:hypothetical protein